MSDTSVVLQSLLNQRKNNKPTFWEVKSKTITPCPFCGSIDIHLVQEDWMHWCCCTDCGVEGPVRDTRINAIKMWQQRSK